MNKKQFITCVTIFSIIMFGIPICLLVSGCRPEEATMWRIIQDENDLYVPQYQYGSEWHQYFEPDVSNPTFEVIRYETFEEAENFIKREMRKRRSCVVRVYMLEETDD